jgi:hypothetical protein
MAQHKTSREGTGPSRTGERTPAIDIPIQSEKLGEILEQKPTGPTGNGMKGHAALIEPSKFDRSQSKFSYQRGNHFTCFGMIARYEYGLSCPVECGFVPRCAAGRWLKALTRRVPTKASPTISEERRPPRACGATPSAFVTSTRFFPFYCSNFSAISLCEVNGTARKIISAR